MKKTLITIIVALFFIPNLTLAFFSDSESSAGSFAAGTLDFDVIPSTHSSGISESFSPNFGFTINNTGSATPEFLMTVTPGIDCDINDFYDELWVEMSNGTESYSGLLTGLMFIDKDLSGFWSMEVSATNNFGASLGETCSFVLNLSAYQSTIGYGNGGFTATGTVAFTLTAGETAGPQDTDGIVLNEIYAHPNTASSSPLNIEWVELYNGTDIAIDVAGWSIGELSGIVEKTSLIVSSCPTTNQSDYMVPWGTTDTEIEAGGFLVVQFCGGSNYLNNTGDTVTLYNDTSTLLDSYTYITTTEGKSDARVPDGATWVDPIPSPGVANIETVTENDLEEAGWSKEEIAEALNVDEEDENEDEKGNTDTNSGNQLEIIITRETLGQTTENATSTPTTTEETTANGGDTDATTTPAYISEADNSENTDNQDDAATSSENVLTETNEEEKDSSSEEESVTSEEKDTETEATEVDGNGEEDGADVAEEDDSDEGSDVEEEVVEEAGKNEEEDVEEGPGQDKEDVEERVEEEPVVEEKSEQEEESEAEEEVNEDTV